MEDLKTPIMMTKYHSSYLTAGCWSPSRTGVFYVTRMDGVVDIWDFFFSQNEVAYSHKVGDAGLSSISVQGTTHGGGRLVAAGDVNGTVSLLQVSESLAEPQTNEKNAILGMFERETKREKNLEARARDIKKKQAAMEAEKKKEKDELAEGKDDKMEEVLRGVDADFLSMIKAQEDDGGAGGEVKGDGGKE